MDQKWRSFALKKITVDARDQKLVASYKNEIKLMMDLSENSFVVRLYDFCIGSDTIMMVLSNLIQGHGTRRNRFQHIYTESAANEI